MRFLCVNQPTRANIFGQEYVLNPLDPHKENIEDILVTDTASAMELLERHADVLVNIDLVMHDKSRFPRLIDRLQEIRPGEKVLILRNGGIGDHVALLPALAAYRECFPPGCQIWLATQKEKQALFIDNPYVDRLWSLPLRLPQFMEADCLLDFSSRRDWYDFESLPMTDSYLHFLKIDYEKIADKAPRLYWPGTPSVGFSAFIRKIRAAQESARPLVLLNWKASNRLRDMPPQKFLFLAERFKDIDFLVAQSSHLQSATAQILQNCSGRLHDATPWMKSLEDYLAAISQCDAVVSTDTASGHLAEALGKPSLILFGPTRDQVWIKYYRKTMPLRAGYAGRSCRSPCGLIKNLEQGCPEAVLLETNYSPCLESVKEETIIAAFKDLLRLHFGIGL